MDSTSELISSQICAFCYNPLEEVSQGGKKGFSSVHFSSDGNHLFEIQNKNEIFPTPRSVSLRGKFLN